MEIFIWEKEAKCAEYHRRFPEKNDRVTVKMPLLFPHPEINSLCLCRKENCPIVSIGACTHRATFTEIFYLGDLTGIIAPELQSVYKYATQT